MERGSNHPIALPRRKVQFPPRVQETIVPSSRPSILEQIDRFSAIVSVLKYYCAEIIQEFSQGDSLYSTSD